MEAQMIYIEVTKVIGPNTYSNAYEIDAIAFNNLLRFSIGSDHVLANIYVHIFRSMMCVMSCHFLLCTLFHLCGLPVARNDELHSRARGESDERLLAAGHYLCTHNVHRPWPWIIDDDPRAFLIKIH